jgi:outer membrane protein assembly factor BamB
LIDFVLSRKPLVYSLRPTVQNILNNLKISIGMKRLLQTLLAIVLCLNITAQDLVQWRGENRDGIYKETGLLKKWPENGPKLLWHFDELGDGHASAAVTSSMVYTAGTIEGKGYVFALDHSGKLLWKTTYGPEWTENWPGVRTTPLIEKDNLYLLSGFALLTCMDAKTGNIKWSNDLMKNFNGRNITWAITENLLIDENKLFCTLGGEDANVIALDKNSGQLIWKSKGNGEKSAYCSPAMIKLATKHVLVTMTEKSILGIDAATGIVLWKHEQTNQWSVHANTPLYKDGLLYCISGYGKGGVMLKLSPDGSSITEAWRNNTLENRMGGVILLNDRLYGPSDSKRKLICIDWKTGNELFSLAGMAPGNIISADGLLYCYSESGMVGLVEPKADGLNLLSSFKVPFGANQHWAHLVISNKRLYVRHGTSLMVYDISAE